MSNKSFTIRPFEKLKKKIGNKQVVPAIAPVRQKKKEQFTDDELFNNAMDDVQKIEAFRMLNCDRYHPKDFSASIRPDSDREALTILCEIAEGQRPMHLPDTQEYVSWTSSDYRDTIIPKLHEGHFSVQAFLDLHGCSVPEAEEELQDFLQDAFKKGLCCVKIIHGRGLRSVKGPRIKDAVVRRLAGHYHRNVIAFVTARQCDGGLGALYVLLRK
jgi:DNA-nicking Smr family endonuclease